MGGGIVKMVHGVEHPDGPFMTIKEVAEYFERDKDTIRRWLKKLPGIPSHKMILGDGKSPNAFVWLFTESDLEKLDEYSGSIKMGRPW